MSYDLITVGRVTMDLHAQNIGAPFEEITGFDTMVDRFEAVRGRADIKWRTDDLMTLLRGED